jgi:hypothetical protein
MQGGIVDAGRSRDDAPVAMHGEGLATVAEFVVEPCDTVPFVLTYSPSHLPGPPGVAPRAALSR